MIYVGVFVRLLIFTSWGGESIGGQESLGVLGRLWRRERVSSHGIRWYLDGWGFEG